MAIQRIDPEKCVGCKQCVLSCPADVIRMNEVTRKAEVRYPEDCRICMWCVSVCKRDAIEMVKVKIPPLFTAWG